MSIKKTFKREIAVALLLWLIYIVEVKDVSMIEVLVWPIFTFVGAAFGIDAYIKQLQSKSSEPTSGWRSEGSSQYTGGEDQLTDGRNDK
jgi:hypothetical protein